MRNAAILRALNQGRCPDCNGESFLAGSSAGVMENIKCSGCGAEFNYCPPCEIATDGIAERITRRDASLDCLKGNPQLVAIAQIDSNLALKLKALLDLLEDADFESAFTVADAVQRTVYDRYIATRQERGNQ